MLAGLVLWLAYPPVAFWLAAPVGVAALALAVRGQSVRRGALLGLLGGAAQMLPLLHWTSAVAGALAWLALVALQVVFFAGLGAGLAATSRLAGWPIWGAALWVAEEALRDRVPFGGFPWGRLAFSQIDGPLAPIIAVGGAPSLTFAVALLGGLLAAGVLAVRARRWQGAALGTGLAVLVVGTAVLVPTPTDGPELTVAVVQGNVPRLGLAAFAQREAVLRNHVAVTRQLAADVRAGRVEQPAVVVWPENASDVDPLSDPGAYALIDGAVKDVGVPVLVGALVETPDGGVTNSSLVWDPVRGPVGRYDKQQLVPFGEYMPFRDQLRRISSKVDLVARDFTAGSSPGILTLGPTVVGEAICYEVAFDPLLRQTVRDGARMLVVPTNNATFGRSAQPAQQLAISRMRALEYGRSTLVAATSGISALVAPDGSVVRRSGNFTQEVLVAPLPERTALTLATRVGAWPELALVLLAAAGMMAALRQREDST